MFITVSKNTEFLEAIMQRSPLDLAIGYIQHNIDIDSVYESDEILKWVAENYDPSDVFHDKQLRQWAKENNLVEDSDG